jgi:predicted nuclease of predicted toxin-antitoxin system
MRVLIDEDVPVQLVEPLRRVAPGHQIDHVADLSRWAGKKDPTVYREAKARQYEAIITNDRAQFDDPEITADIRRSGLHHIRYSQKQKGVRGG